MRNDPRLIGFTAHRGCGPLSKPTHATFSIRRSLDPIKDRAHPSSRNSSSEFLRSCTSPFTLRCSASPALGFRSLFATSLERGYVCSRSLPRSTSFRPQAFTTSRRLLPLSSLQAYSIPQPRPGSDFVQGLLSQCSRSSSSEDSFPPCRCCFAARTRAPTFAGSRARPRTMPLGFEALLHTRPRSSGPVIHLAQSRSPLRISRSSRSLLSRRRPPLSRLPSALDVTRSMFTTTTIFRRSRSCSSPRCHVRCSPGQTKRRSSCITPSKMFTLPSKHRFGTLGASVASRLTALSLHARSSLGHGHGRARLRSRARSPCGGSSAESRLVHLSVMRARGVTARSNSRSSRGRVAVSRIGASLAGRFLIDPQWFAFPGSFRIPSRSSPRSPHGGRGRLRFFHSEVFERGSSMLAFRRSRSLRFDHPLGGRGRARSFSSHLSVQKVRSAFTPASALILRVHALSPCDDRARPRRRSPLCVCACFTSAHLAVNDVPAFATASRCSLAQSRDPFTFRRSSLLSVRKQPRSFIGFLPCSLALRRSDTSVVDQRPLRHSRSHAPTTPCDAVGSQFVITSRRSCSRSHA